MHFLMKIFDILFQISVFVPKPGHNKKSLVQVMVWHLTGDKQSPEPMLT